MDQTERFGFCFWVLFLSIDLTYSSNDFVVGPCIQPQFCQLACSAHNGCFCCMCCMCCLRCMCCMCLQVTVLPPGGWRFWQKEGWMQ